MARNPRVFIAFAIEDKWARDHLVGQSKNDRTPFEWVDMSVKQPWETDWEARCATRIRGCAGMIAIVTKNSAKATGQLYEVGVAKSERIPLMGMYATRDNRPTTLPSALQGVPVKDWTWANIEAFINGL